MRQTITSRRVEARAFLDGARKVRYFDTVQEADEWFLDLHAKHAGVQTESIEHATTFGISAARSVAVRQEPRPMESFNGD
jgi:hypothetical protein